MLSEKTKNILPEHCFLANFEICSPRMNTENENEKKTTISPLSGPPLRPFGPTFWIRFKTRILTHRAFTVQINIQHIDTIQHQKRPPFEHSLNNCHVVKNSFSAPRGCYQPSATTTIENQALNSDQACAKTNNPRSKSADLSACERGWYFVLLSLYFRFLCLSSTAPFNSNILFHFVISHRSIAS